MEDVQAEAAKAAMAPKGAVAAGRGHSGHGTQGAVAAMTARAKAAMAPKGAVAATKPGPRRARRPRYPRGLLRQQQLEPRWP